MRRRGRRRRGRCVHVWEDRASPARRREGGERLAGDGEDFDQALRPGGGGGGEGGRDLGPVQVRLPRAVLARLRERQPQHRLGKRPTATSAEVAKARWLQMLSMSRCKRLMDMGLICIAVGCPDLRELSLKWCIGVSHLGLDLLALKSKKLNILDLSYTMVCRLKAVLRDFLWDS